MFASETVGGDRPIGRPACQISTASKSNAGSIFFTDIELSAAYHSTYAGHADTFAIQIEHIYCPLSHHGFCNVKLSITGEPYIFQSENAAAVERPSATQSR